MRYPALMGKLRIGVLFGGRSGEHEVSLRSAASVMAAIDKAKYEVVPIGITKQGEWLTGSGAVALLNSGRGASLAASQQPATLLRSGDVIVSPPVPGGPLQAFQTSAACSAVEVDAVFPVLHGTFGEDGTIQGLLELADVAYVGAGVLGSSAGMDKDVMKRLFRDAGLPLVKHLTVLRGEWECAPELVGLRLANTLRYPVFVKPANLGSSVGISKVHDLSELAPAMNEAALYDRKIVIEEGVGGTLKARELECAVLGNDDPKASVVGEVVPIKEFYDYDAKYIDEGSKLSIPANLIEEQTNAVRVMAIKAFLAVDCSGLGRIDFLMDPVTEDIYLNEINTMPGFTSISMYPKLWAATGIEYPALIDRLIELGLERHRDKKRNRYTK